MMNAQTKASQDAITPAKALELLKEGLPSRIDRSVWGPRYSGTTGQQLMTALKSLNLINENGTPNNSLENLVNSNGTQRQL
ncbi:MAG: hypothetical protein VW912_09205, partial [Flavobacteriaceae bacterium]